jgi:hypothetical protein
MLLMARFGSTRFFVVPMEPSPLTITILGPCFTPLDINAVHKRSFLHLLKALHRRQQGAREARRVLTRVRGRCSLSRYSGRRSAHACSPGTTSPMRRSLTSAPCSCHSTTVDDLFPPRRRLPIRKCTSVSQSSLARLTSKRVDCNVGV